MPVFVTLPSGLVLNLALVRRIAPSDQQGMAALSVYFSDDDFSTLNTADSDALAKRLRSTGAVGSSNIKVVVFWLVILLAILLVWLTIHR